MNIRCVYADDAEAFSALRQEVILENAVPMGLTYKEELRRTKEEFRAQLSFSEPNAMFGYFVEEELVATAAVGHTSKFASSRHKMMMWGVFTSPRFRRRGLCRKLVKLAIDHAFRTDVNRVNLQVYIPNDAAIALYKSLGFVEYGTEPEAVYIDGKYHDGVHMTLLKRRMTTT